MTKSELDQIRARANAATPGPWYMVPPDPDAASNIFSIGARTPPGHWPMDACCECGGVSNAAFVTAARTDVPALCDALARAMEALAVAHELLDTGNYYDDDAREHGKQLIRQWEASDHA